MTPTPTTTTDQSRAAAANSAPTSRHDVEAVQEAMRHAFGHRPPTERDLFAAMRACGADTTQTRAIDPSLN